MGTGHGWSGENGDVLETFVCLTFFLYLVLYLHLRWCQEYLCQVVKPTVDLETKPGSVPL